jgi:serine/threonine protein kinase
VISYSNINAELIGRRPVFTGRDTMEQIEQLVVVLGKPPDTFINSCRKCEVRRFLRCLTVDKLTPLNELYPRASKNAIDLMKKLLQYDPSERLTARRALKHPFLQKYHTRHSLPLVLPASEFMYEHCVCNIEQLRSELLLEGLN